MASPNVQNADRNRLVRMLSVLPAVLGLACASPPVTYTAEEYEAKKATWRALFEDVGESCETQPEHACALLNVSALDYVLHDGVDVLSLESYSSLWELEQAYREQYAIEGSMHDDAPVPDTPSQVAESRAKRRSDYEAREPLLTELLAARAARFRRPQRARW